MGLDRACCRRFAAPCILPLLTRTRHAAIESRRPSHDAPAMPRPCRGLVPAAPPSVVSCPAPLPFPVRLLKGCTEPPAHTCPSTTTTAPLAPPLDLAVKPYISLLLRANPGSKRVALELLVLSDFPTPPSLARPPPPTTRSSPKLLLTAGSPTPTTPAPTEHTNRILSTSSCSPTPFPLPPTSFPRWILAGKHLAPLRDYIAITKFFLGSIPLDPRTYLRELEYFCFQEAVTCKINLKS
jgi:hypothetical protein